jgi:streptogramin lyase
VRPIEDDKAGEELTLDDPAYSLASTGSDLWATTEGGVARIDPAARQVLGGPVNLEAGSGSEIAAGEGALWVTDTIDNSVIQADAETARAVDDPIAVGSTMRNAIVAGEGAVWVLRADVDADTTEVVQIDTAKKEAGKSVRTGTFSSTEALAAGEGGVWTAGGEDETRLVRVDPAGLKLDSRNLMFEDGISAIAAGEGAVWVLDGQGLTVTRVDPETIKPVGQPIAVAAGGDSRLAVTDDAVWVLSPRRGALRITWSD